MRSKDLFNRDWANSKSLRLLCITCQVYAVSMVALVPVCCVFIIYIWPETEPVSFSFSFGLAVYEVSNLLLNWIYFKTSLNALAEYPSSVSDNRELSYCPICVLHVRRRDHHCFFLGGCVGSVNLVNFVTFCFHASIGLIYASVILTNYLRLDYKDLCSVDFIYYFLPFAVAKWLTGNIIFRHLAVVALLSTALATCVSTFSIFVFEMYLVYSWKTSRELWRRHTPVHMSTSSRRNFEKVFGRYWIRAFILPTRNTRKLLQASDEPMKRV